MRRDPRFASPHGLLVRCETWGEFVERYASDISQGGMYIVTEQAPEILSEVDVVLQLPEGHEIQLRASIVHVLDADRAKLEGREPGVGVQFIGLDAQRKAQIYQLVEYARWEGATGGASLASRLFEVSASLPPKKIMEALPLDVRAAPPGASRRPPSPSAGVPAQRSAAPPTSGGSSQRARAASGRPRSQASKAPTPVPGSVVPAIPAAAGNGEQPAQAAAPQQPSVPLDLEKLKLGMTHLVHKRFDQALLVFGELARDSHADAQPHTWLALTHARIKLRDNDEAAASEHYRRVLAFDEAHHEARKFIRDYHAKRRLTALPFGRYFIKK
ncbi:MAG TPA: PilZ domain-containing protein [Polyangiales bacterium]|nr:PilZ domain-containing protein [Polyangiales bacterium]